MKINDIPGVDHYTKIKKEIKTEKIDKDKMEPKEKMAVEPKEEKIDIDVLRAEADKAYSNLRRIVEDLLKRQGIEIEKLPELKPEDIKVDQKARDEAQQMIDEGGPLSPESVSKRIVDFAKSISDGDKSKAGLLRKAIDDGFEAAKKAWGDELPEISQKTYDLIQTKLDEWENE